MTFEEFKTQKVHLILITISFLHPYKLQIEMKREKKILLFDLSVAKAPHHVYITYAGNEYMFHLFDLHLQMDLH